MEEELYKFEDEADIIGYYLDNVPILAISLSSKVVFLNKNMSKSIGRSKSEIIGLSSL